MALGMDSLKERVRSQMPEKRWAHTLGVMESSVELAGRFGGDPVKAELAALLHDYCKYWPVDKQKDALLRHNAAGDLLGHDKALWHGPAAAAVIPGELGITDPEVLDAVRWHTSGREGMTLLDKIVCLADYIEPGRDFPGVHRIRKLAEHSLENALVAGFDSTISFLLEKGSAIYPLTVLSRNALLEELKSNQANREDTL
ncbi:bis(5'-nucleosyl)-tetraphosphatase (symmetrical) YqeK [Gorillibacterium sp. sgz5001074]|uniref:bis(5'-nucleosyl)-tetraphosphatase (symmetrical) YqeK n=1 Tax=Gorillibacterium sp. sgz5001074 TaxID=3446695 RepID=UPI003F674858